MAGMNYQLVVRSGPIPGKIYPILKDEIIIGRDPSCEVLVNDAEVSRHHASVRLQGGGFMLEDLGSTNGTVVNGQKLAGPHFLHPGEVITLGQHVSLVFEAEPSYDPDATMVTPRVDIPLTPPVIPQQTPFQAQVPYPNQKPLPQYRPIEPPTAPPAASQGYGDIPGVKTAADDTTVKKSNRKIIIILLAVFALLVICCVGVLIFIDNNMLWCTVMPFIPGCQ
jgi:hypothetical protein